MSAMEIIIIGGGLAGVEAAWQASRHGVGITLFEMKPKRFSPAHHSPDLAELVCSNSFRSSALENAAGLLKEEMRRLGSLVIQTADETQVSAGSCLAVDRDLFSKIITERLEATGVRVIREEITQIPKSPQVVVIATGPLPSEAMAAAIKELTGSGALYFYDAIAPIVDGRTINYDKVFWASRYDKEGQDYLNCPLDKDAYYHFVDEIIKAEKVPLRGFEEIPPFEGCMPIEDLAARGKDTLAFGPMKPVGLINPKTGEKAFAVVQLRRDNVSATLLNIVGFQTKMTISEQKRVLRLIPGLEDAEFFRYGSLHRNAFVNAPRLFLPGLQLKREPRIFFAGQITGVEGYIESAATGLIVGRNAVRWAGGLPMELPPRTTALGALLNYIHFADPDTFQPMHINFGIFPSLPEGTKKMPKKHRRMALAQRALEDLDRWILDSEGSY